MIHLDELYYGNISGGTFDGYCAVTLELGRAREASASALLSTILSFGRMKIFRVVGDSKKTPTEDLFTLLSSLKENGYVTIAVLDGKTKEPWMDQVSYRVANITEAPWLLFQVNELHFQPIAKEDLQPPCVTEIHTKAICYLDVNRELTATTVFEFLKKYPLWRLYSPASKAYRMALTLKEETDD
jgi:hypothetical protein